MKSISAHTISIAIPEYVQSPLMGKGSLQSISSPKLLHNFQPRNSLSLRRLSWTSFDSAPTFLTQAKIGLVSNPPELCQEGTGGTYFLKNPQSTPIAVFKPSDEEPLCPHNPKRTNNLGDFHFKGFIPGEGSKREIFAFLADKQFAGVPETLPAEVSHWIFTDNNGIPGRPNSALKTKKGSLQRFISDIQCSAEEMGPGKFSVKDVQRIAILDMLLFNCDRNGGNILVKKNSHKLVPIDHGFCLPHYKNTTDLQWFEWLTWRQVKQEILPEVFDFIQNFDIVSAVLQASKLGIGKESILTLQLAYAFLRYVLTQKPKMTLYDIAKLMCTRAATGQPSEFSKLVAAASSTSTDSAVILQSFTQELRKYFS